jgi:hypothetical protein
MAAGKSEKISEYISVFADVFGYLELAMGSMSYLQIACKCRSCFAIPFEELKFETKIKTRFNNY